MFSPLRRKIFGIVTLSSVVIAPLASLVVTSTEAIAQVNSATTLSEQTLRDARQQEQSPLSIGGSNLNIMQLINNINLAGGKSPQQFQSEQSESLDDAVQNFRNQQRRDIKISIPSNNQ
ncbi:MAG: hypothetical protein NW214_00755 [Pseudanabaenaceae cyanobacterium bins.39]|nr:hypothetical protein [Pseudanabaenaceae cyanobacterium bins.39]